MFLYLRRGYQEMHSCRRNFWPSWRTEILRVYEVTRGGYRFCYLVTLIRCAVQHISSANRNSTVITRRESYVASVMWSLHAKSGSATKRGLTPELSQRTQFYEKRSAGRTITSAQTSQKTTIRIGFRG